MLGAIFSTGSPNVWGPHVHISGDMKHDDGDAVR